MVTVKPGTKFKLECVFENGAVRFGGRTLYDRHGRWLSPSDFKEQYISDVRGPPRKRFTDCDGKVYEILEQGDAIVKGDIFHNSSNRLRCDAHGRQLYADANGVYLRPVTS